MRKILFATGLALFAIVGSAFACDADLQQQLRNKAAGVKEAIATSQYTPISERVNREALPSELTAEETDFLVNGPRLYPMDKALALSRETGKPVVCWMGKHIFADAKARKASLALGDTTIQAAMDDDGIPIDRDGKDLTKMGPRVKFSTSNYSKDAQTAYIQVKNLNDESPAKILRFVRGNTGR